MSSVLPTTVPEGWRRLRFDRVVRRSKEAGRPELDPLSVYLEEGVVPRSSREDNHNRLGAEMSNYLVVHPGDIVFNKLRTWQGGLGVSRHLGVVSPAYFVCRPVDSVDSRYYHYLLRSNVYLAELTRLSKFMPPSQFDIAWDELRTLPILVPPLPEQRAIADYLDAETARIEALITKKRRMIELLEEAWRSLRAGRTIGSLNPVDGLGHGPPEAPDTLNLGVLIELQRGHDLPADSRQEGTVPIVSSGGVSGYHSVAGATGPGVVTGRYGTIGEVFYIDEDYWPLNTTLYVKDFRGNDPRWVHHLLAAIPLDAEKDKSAVTGINRNVIGRLRIPRPPLIDQIRIGRDLDRSQTEFEAATAKLKAQVSLLKERRRALITAVVSGDLPPL